MTDVFDHPWLGGLFGDAEIASILSPEAELTRYLRIEAAWSTALGFAEVGAQIASLSIMPVALRDGTTRDGVPIPELVKQIKAALPDAPNGSIHAGLTSQDVVDTSLMMALQDISEVLIARAVQVTDVLEEMKTHLDGHSLMAVTRMQPALPIGATQLIDSWTRPVRVAAEALSQTAQGAKILQWGGPVGIRDVEDAKNKGARFATLLGLRDPGHAWHTDRAPIITFAQSLSALTTGLGKMGQDIALLALMGPDQIKIRGGGGSSAMPHKSNPIDAEMLVSLAHYNAGQISTLQMHGVHEMQRSGARWTLEWMVLPYMARTTGQSLSTATQLLKKIEAIGTQSQIKDSGY